ncbi:MAG TPA: HIT family protein [Caulobacteraceae bacterium]|jgi:histidine triad (HIT) family protein|nr:HIT family protein [Caulobacteraceae bacterium]
MSLDGAYDPDNIFAKIVRGEAPAAKVFEDADTLAIMDVFPQGRGHVLVIHKCAHARNLLDVEPQALHAVIDTTQRVARAARTAFKPDGVFIAQFNGAAAGQTVFHLHFHIIPRWEGVPLARHGAGGMADMSELKAQAEQIAREIA